MKIKQTWKIKRRKRVCQIGRNFRVQNCSAIDRSLLFVHNLIVPILNIQTMPDDIYIPVCDVAIHL